MSAYHAAVDLGAGSGRVLLGSVTPGDVRLLEVHRFVYQPRQVDGHLRWNFAQLLDGMHTGLRKAGVIAREANATLRSVGVDSWGVDYGLIDAGGRLVEEPVCYRDDRTAGVMERAFARVPREQLFEATGIQFLVFNTIYQLMAQVEEGLPPNAARVLMIPDLCHHALCGSTSGELTNASTTQLLSLTTGEWDHPLFASLGLPRELMPSIGAPGTGIGRLRDTLQRDLDLPPLAVIQPATHDTGSAVAGTPLTEGWAYISSGTWSLVGVERTEPLAGKAVLAANFTNERGVAGTYRFLKNVAGLWLLESCRREWQAAGVGADLPALLAAAAAVRESPGLVYPDALRFFNPRSMLAELNAALAETGRTPASNPAAMAKVILDSLACRYASVVGTIEKLTGQSIPGVHIVGGGSLNDYLNQATANATGRPVVAGPVEATGLGNILMQSVACGLTTIAEGRRLIAQAFPLRTYEPRDAGMWSEVREQYRSIEQAAL